MTILKGLRDRAMLSMLLRRRPRARHINLPAEFYAKRWERYGSIRFTITPSSNSVVMN